MTDSREPSSPPPQPPLEPKKAGLKLLLELGPLMLFLALNWKFDLITATGGFLIAILVALPFSWRLERKLPVMALVTAAFVGVFGGLTLWLDDATFIQLKPTVASVFIAVALLGGLARGKLFLASLLGTSLRMDEAGWRTLTVRWAGFFLVVALLNEIVRRTCSEDTWVTFKVFGILSLTFVFMISQAGLMKRHELKEVGEGAGEDDTGEA